MGLYVIADLGVEFTARFENIIKRSKKYEVGGLEKIDIKISVSDESLSSFLKKAPNLTPEEAEYLLLGAEFYRQLLNYDGFFLHSSAVAVDDEAYLFSAPCGTGKSTHTALWQEYFGKDKAQIINDDKPAIRIVDGAIKVYGTPFSGKTTLNVNTSVPLKGICFIEQSSQNRIKVLEQPKSVVEILNQTIRPHEIEMMDKLLVIIEKVIQSIQIYKMGCNISQEAVKLSYNTMKNEI